MKTQIQKLLNKIASATGYIFYAFVFSAIIFRILEFFLKYLL